MSLRAVLVAVVLLGTLGACSLERSGYQFVRSPSTGTYLKVPDDWKVFGQKDIKALVAETKDLPDGFETVLPFVSTFGAGRDLVAYPFDPFGEEPAGIVQVRRLDREERDLVSFASLRNQVVPIDEGQADGSVQVLRQEEFEGGETVRGERVVFALDEPETGLRLVIDQTTLVDDATSRVYLLAVGCVETCYEEHRNEIDDVVTSLTIKER